MSTLKYFFPTFSHSKPIWLHDTITSDVTNTCCCNRGKVSQTNKQTNHMIRYQTKPDYTHACSCNRGKVDSRREEDAQMLGLNARQIQNHLKGGTRNDKIRGILIFQSIPWWRSFNFFLLYECIYICVQNNSFPKDPHHQNNKKAASWLKKMSIINRAPKLFTFGTCH